MSLCSKSVAKYIVSKFVRRSSNRVIVRLSREAGHGAVEFTIFPLTLVLIGLRRATLENSHSEFAVAKASFRSGLAIVFHLFLSHPH